ncbi:adenylate/guanylate cyclase domain-containing protein [Comamonas serinivorans]|uniref:adenylate/guanylate cyclase domain-containing protein n=1 Tax=Comamonas serinivorans TaxID=1082851 RepID=UPI001F34C0B2|nr:adenylate/guanylate cyclase domain-containing protein [Comamonas serinivorans]
MLLQQSPELDSVYVADAVGHMLMVQRYPEPAVRHIARSHGITQETWEYKPLPDDQRDPRQRFQTQRVEVRQSQYNPVARTWFTEAVRTGQPVWTTPYIFQAAQELGVTYAIPDYRRDGDDVQLMVVSGDVTLGRLSDFVHQFSSAGYGHSALISAEQQVLARSDVPGRTRSLSSPQGGVLGAIHAHLQAEGRDGTASVHFPLMIDGQRFLVQASRIASTGWQLVSWVPEDQLLGGLRRSVLLALGAMMVFLGIVLLLALHLSKRVTTPVEQLSHIARRIGRLDLDELPRVNSPVLELQHLDHALDESARGLRAFRRFVPLDVVQQLLDEGRPLQPSGEPREVTVMFTDIHGFTTLAESTPTTVLVDQLTQYFNVASEVIARHGGTIDKFTGDGIMVLWGAPTELPDAELKACQAALALLEATDRLNARWAEQQLAPFDTRIGIHTGVVVAGVLGAHDRLAYTAVGDTVNVASRIEGINRKLGTRVLVSDTTAQALAGRLTTRPIDAVELRGRQQPLMVHELLPLTRGD